MHDREKGRKTDAEGGVEAQLCLFGRLLGQCRWSAATFKPGSDGRRFLTIKPQLTPPEKSALGRRSEPIVGPNYLVMNAVQRSGLNLPNWLQTWFMWNICNMKDLTSGWPGNQYFLSWTTVYGPMRETRSWRCGQATVTSYQPVCQLFTSSEFATTLPWDPVRDCMKLPCEEVSCVTPSGMLVWAWLTLKKRWALKFILVCVIQQDSKFKVAFKTR